MLWTSMLAVGVERKKQLCEVFKGRISYVLLCNKSSPNFVA